MRSKTFVVVSSALVGFCAGYLGGFFNARAIYDEIPTTVNQVQAGFAVPSQLEIDLQDVDVNGEDETHLRYAGRDYLLTLDEQGNPQVQTYEVKPAEIVMTD